MGKSDREREYDAVGFCEVMNEASDGIRKAREYRDAIVCLDPDMEIRGMDEHVANIDTFVEEFKKRAMVCLEQNLDVLDLITFVPVLGEDDTDSEG